MRPSATNEKFIKNVYDYSDPELIRIELDRITLTALAWGDAGAEPILALHGWLDNAASFIPMASELANFRLVALDLPGHGASGHRPKGYHYHFVDYVSDVVAVADKLGFDRFRLLGHSLGGAVAICSAAVMAQRVEKLALIESTGPYVAEPQEAPERLMAAHGQMTGAGRRRLPVYKELDTIVRARMTASPMSQAAARLIVERSLKQVEGGWSWRSDVGLKVSSPMYLSEAQVHAYLGALTMPTLLIRGTESGFMERKFLVDRQRLISQLQVVDLPGLHHLHMDTPAAVARPIREFFVTGSN